MPRASTNAQLDASSPRVAWTVAVAALAVLAGRELQRASTCALHPKDEARAAALVEAEVGRLLTICHLLVLRFVFMCTATQEVGF